MANELSMKLLVDKSTKKVLFAEAGKDVVDFLFNFLAMPLGTVVKLLKDGTAPGCIGNLYKSVESLDQTYLLDNQIKASLLNPTVSSPSLPTNNLFLTDAPFLTGSTCTGARNIYYACTRKYDHHYEYGGCGKYVADVNNTKCPGCGNAMTKKMTYVGTAAADAAAIGDGGFVKGVVTYTVMDDLSVMPMSTISSITLLNKFHVKDVGILEERNVSLGMEEGLKILEASLQSKTVLTDVFLGMKSSAGK